MATNPEAEKDAEDILNVWEVIAGGRRFPVDPARIATELGVDVFEAQLDPSVSGAIVKKEGSDPTILVNRADHPNRQRFSTAHELGHYVRRQADPFEYEYIDYRGELASQGADPEEIFANAFAAALLMPKSDVKRLVKSGASPVDMAFHFKVSQDAMTYRLKNLGLLGAGA